MYSYLTNFVSQKIYNLMKKVLIYLVLKPESYHLLATDINLLKCKFIVSHIKQLRRKHGNINTF